MIIEGLLRKLPEDIRARIGGVTVSAAAFADGMLLFASTGGGGIAAVNQYLRGVSG